MNYTNTRVWNIDNQLVVAYTIEEAIALAKEYNKDYYSLNEPRSIDAVTSNCGLPEGYLAVIKK